MALTIVRRLVDDKRCHVVMLIKYTMGRLPQVRVHFDYIRVRCTSVARTLDPDAITAQRAIHSIPAGFGLIDNVIFHI